MFFSNPKPTTLVTERKKSCKRHDEWVPWYNYTAYIMYKYYDILATRKEALTTTMERFAAWRKGDGCNSM